MISALAERLSRHGVLSPNKVALIAESRTWTYGEFDALTSRAAVALADAGVRAGDRVVLQMLNCAELVFAHYGCFKAGAIAVPIGLGWKPREIAQVLNDTAPKAYIGLADLYEASGIGAWSEKPALRYIVNRSRHFAGEREYSELLRESASAATRPLPVSGKPAAILYTSGSTAAPIGMVHTDRSLLWRLQPAMVDSKETVVIGMPIVHPFAFVTLVANLAAGATVVIVPSFNGDALLNAVQQHRGTMTIGVPALYYALLESQVRARIPVPALRNCVVGGDSIPTDLQVRFARAFGLDLLRVYGSTDCGLIAIDGTNEVRTGTLGYPVSGVEARVMSEDGKEVPVGQVGELRVRSPGLSIGYWTSSGLEPLPAVDGWYATGDLASANPDGFLLFHGRKKQVIVRAGLNVPPQEVEDILLLHPAVADAAVIGLPHPIFGEAVVACIVPRAGALLSEPDVQAFARMRLADYKTPERVVLVSELARTNGGKIDRNAIRQVLAKSQPSALGYSYEA